MSIHSSEITADDRQRKARLRSCDAAVKRLTRATSEVASAMIADLQVDEMGRGIAIGRLIEADRDAQAARTLIRDCRRSLGDPSYKPEEGE